MQIQTSHTSIFEFEMYKACSFLDFALLVKDLRFFFSNRCISPLSLKWTLLLNSNQISSHLLIMFSPNNVLHIFPHTFNIAIRDPHNYAVHMGGSHTSHIKGEYCCVILCMVKESGLLLSKEPLFHSTQWSPGCMNVNMILLSSLRM